MLAPSAPAISLYWDTNGTAAGAVTPAASPANGTWGVSNFWSTSATGTAEPRAWTPFEPETPSTPNIAVFSAGSGASGGLATGANSITVAGTQSAGGLTFEEGITTFNGGTLMLQGAGAAPGMIILNANTQVINSTIGGSNGITIARGPSIFGGGVTFGAANSFLGALTINSGRLNINAEGAAGSGTIVLTPSASGTNINSTAIPNSVITLANPFTINGGVGIVPDISSAADVTLALNGKISGAGNWTHGGVALSTGNLVLTNTANDFTGTVTVSSGALVLMGDHVLGNAGAATPNATVSNTVITSTGQVAFSHPIGFTYATNEQLIIASGATAGQVQINNIGGDNVFAGGVQFNQATVNTIGVDGGSLTLSGQVIAAAAGSKSFNKVGAGTLIITGETTTGFNAAVNINGGRMVLAGTTETAGDIASATSVTINRGSILELDNTAGNNQARLGNSAAVNLNGSHLLLRAHNTNTSEEFGALTVNPGEDFVSTITTVPAAEGAVLVGASFDRSAGSLAVFRAPDLGAAGVAGVGRVLFQTAPTLTGAGGSGTDKSIIVGALGDTSITGGGTDFVTYDAATGVKPLAAADYATSINSGTAELNNVALSSAASITGNTTINSLKLAHADAGVAIASDNFTINTGMIHVAASSTAGISGAGTLAFERPGIVTGAGDLTISANIGNSGTFTKAGTGKLILSGSNSLGTVYISGGALLPTNTAALGPGSIVHVGGGGTLELPDGMNLTGTELILHNGGRLLGRGNSSFGRDQSPRVTDGSYVIIEAADAGGVFNINSSFTGTATANNRPTISLRGPGTVNFVPPSSTYFGNFEARDGVTIPLSAHPNALGNVGNSLIFGPGGGTVLMHSNPGGTNWNNPVVVAGDAFFNDQSTNGVNTFGQLTVNSNATIAQVLERGLNFIDPGITFGNTVLNADPTFHVDRPPIAGSYGRLTINNPREFGEPRSISKTGSGILTIAGSAGFTGNLNANEGVIFINDSVPTLRGVSGAGTVVGSVVLRNGAEIAPGYNGVGTLLIEGITINGTDDNAAHFDMEGDATGFDQLFVFGQEKFKLNGPATISLTNLGGVFNGEYVLIDYLTTPMSEADFNKLSLVSNTFGSFTASLFHDVATTQVKLRLEGGPNAAIWNVDSNGTWNDSANWNPALVPNSSIDAASFFSKITAPRTVELDGTRTVAQLNFNSDHSYTIAPGSGGTLRVGTASSNGVMNVINGVHHVTAPLSLDGNVQVNIAAGASLNASGGFSIGANKLATMRGAGRLEVGGPQSHGAGARLAINAGEVVFNSNAGTPATTTSAAAANLAINITSMNTSVVLNADQDLASIRVDFNEMGDQSFDLNSGTNPGDFRSVRVYASDTETAKAALYDAIRNANINGALSPTDGIYDSGMSAHPTSMIGIARRLDAHGDAYLLMRPTRIGDLNLDGLVSIADFIDLAANFNSSGPQITWQEGDLNFDNAVTIADFIDLAGNFNSTYSGQTFAIDPAEQQLLAAFAASHGASAVPEPGTLGLLAGAGLMLLSRRRRRTA